MWYMRRVLTVVTLALLVLAAMYAGWVRPVQASETGHIFWVFYDKAPSAPSDWWWRLEAAKGNIVVDDLTSGIRYQGKTDSSGYWAIDLPVGHIYNYTTWIDGDQSRFSCVSNCSKSQQVVPNPGPKQWLVRWQGTFYEKLTCRYTWNGYGPYACGSAFYTKETVLQFEWNVNGYFDGYFDTVWLDKTPYRQSVKWEIANPNPAYCTTQDPKTGVDNMTGDKTHIVQWVCMD